MRSVDLDSYYDDQLECWIRQENTYCILGITDWTQGYIGSINLITVTAQHNTYINKGKIFATIESNKTSIDLHLPVSAKLNTVNTYVISNPNIINKDCYARSKGASSKGWILQLTEVSERDMQMLLSPDQYQESVDSFFKKG